MLNIASTTGDFRPISRMRGSVDRNTKRRHQGQGDSCWTDLIGLLLKAGQDDQKSRMGISLWAAKAGLCSPSKDMGGQGRGLVEKRLQRTLTKVWSRKELLFISMRWISEFSECSTEKSHIITNDWGYLIAKRKLQTAPAYIVWTCLFTSHFSIFIPVLW